jgi:hypothetical protein
MTAMTSLGGSEKSDPQAVKQWAAEDFAIAIGLLRECPYHGQPFKAHRKGLTSKALAAGLIDPLDPIVQIFHGNTRELLATVESVAGGYSERCKFCADSDREEFD